MIGAGEYDDICTRIREEVHAKGLILAVVQGDKGSSFCIQLPPEFAVELPKVLRQMADQIESDMKLEAKIGLN